VACRHYQALPAATTKPNTSKNLDSIEDIAVRVDTQSGGPQGRCTTDTIEHGRVIGHRRSGGPHPNATPIAPAKVYDPISHIEAIYFGKEFLRMAGIVQMLHGHKPPYDKYQYANRIRIRQVQPAHTNTRAQTRRTTCHEATVPGSCARLCDLYRDKAYSALRSSPVWPILVNLLAYEFRP